MSLNTDRQKISSQHIITGTILLTLLIFLYYSVILGLIAEWSDDPNYTHGFIIPFISLYLIWEERETFNKIPFKPSGVGIFVLFFGLLFYVLGYAGAEIFTMRLSMLVALAGIFIANYGLTLFRALVVPYGYLYFMVPLPYIIYDMVAFPLKLLVAKYSVLTIQSIGIPVYREGNIIMLPHITLEVADACSGIRSLISLLSLGVAFAYFTQKTRIKKIILVLSAIPIAIFANGVRVVGTGILAHMYDPKVAEGFFHEFAGLIIFAVSMAFLIGVGVLLNRIGPKPVLEHG